MRILLRPLSWLYGAVISLRNFCFDTGILPSESFPVPVITVGNLVAGGSGKSPHVLLLIEWLKKDFRVAVLSRGYGRKTKGYREVNVHASVEEAGDEPLQYLHYHPDVTVVVCENRREGIRRMLGLANPPQVILLDDAYQHRYVKAGMNLLLTEFDTPFTEDHLLPEGRLRERKSGASRADYILVTKAPASLHTIPDQLKRKIRKYSNAPQAFTYMRYRDPVSLEDINKTIALTNDKAVFLVTGIARPEPLLDYLEEKCRVVKHLRFRDHHAFEQEDILRLKNEFEVFSLQNTNALICTTRKDAMRLNKGPVKAWMEGLPVYIIDIESRFSVGETEFKNAVLKYVQSVD